MPRMTPLAESRTLVVAVVICGVLAIAGKLADVPALVWAFKPLATIAIALLAAGRAASPYRRSILAGLLLSLAGDVLLIPPNLFVAGLVAFLLAHIAYLHALTRNLRLFARPLPFVVVAGVAAAVLALLWPGLPAALKLPVVAYVVMLGAMTAQAAARAVVLRTMHARRAALGGALFLVSDALLAIDRFHAPLPAASLWVLVTYWTAQVLIALSVEAREQAPAEARRTAPATKPPRR